MRIFINKQEMTSIEIYQRKKITIYFTLSSHQTHPKFATAKKILSIIKITQSSSYQI